MPAGIYHTDAFDEYLITHSELESAAKAAKQEMEGEEEEREEKEEQQKVDEREEDHPLAEKNKAQPQEGHPEGQVIVARILPPPNDESVVSAMSIE